MTVAIIPGSWHSPTVGIPVNIERAQRDKGYCQSEPRFQQPRFTLAGPRLKNAGCAVTPEA